MVKFSLGQYKRKSFRDVQWLIRDVFLSFTFKSTSNDSLSVTGFFVTRTENSNVE